MADHLAYISPGRYSSGGNPGSSGWCQCEEYAFVEYEDGSTSSSGSTSGSDSSEKPRTDVSCYIEPK